MTGAFNAFLFRSLRSPRTAVPARIVYSSLITLALFLLAKLTTPSPEKDAWVHYTVAGMTDVFCVIAVGFIVFIIAPAQIAAQIASERRHGTLDQIRATPISPTAFVMGILVGAPAGLYLLCAVPFAYHALAGITGTIPMSAFVQSTMMLLVGGLWSSLIALALSLSPQKDSVSPLAALAVVGILGMSSMFFFFAGSSEAASWAFMHPVGGLSSALTHPEGLWHRLLYSQYRVEADSASLTSPNFIPLLSVISALVWIGILLRACARKIASPERPLLSKTQAVAIFSLVASEIAVPLWGRGMVDSVLCLSVVVLPLVAFLMMLSAPSQEAWAMAVRRRADRSIFSDAATPHGAALIMLGVLSALSIPFGHSLLEQVPSLIWLSATLLTLPIYVTFATTVLQTSGARVAFAVAMLVHLTMQVAAATLSARARVNVVDTGFVQFSFAIGVLVPVAIVRLQTLARRKVLALA